MSNFYSYSIDFIPLSGDLKVETKRRLKRALSAIDDAISTLQRARSKVEDGRSDISRALSELDDAETNIRKAIRELPDNI